MASTPPLDPQTTPLNGLLTPSTASDRTHEPESLAKQADVTGETKCGTERDAADGGKHKDEKGSSKAISGRYGDVLPAGSRLDDDEESTLEASDAHPGDELSEMRQKLAEITKQMEIFSKHQKKTRRKLADGVSMPFVTPKRSNYNWTHKQEKRERLGLEFISDDSSNAWVSDNEYLERRVINRKQQASKIFKNEIRLLEEEEKTMANIYEERKKWREKEEELLKEIEGLKYELRELKGPETPAPEENQDAESENEGEKVDEVRDPLVRLNRVGWDLFKGVMMSRSISYQQHAIDVLIGDPDISYASMQKLWWMGRNNQYRRAQPKPPVKVVAAVPNKDTIPGQGPVPERIRINSTHLLKILEKIHGSSLYDYATTVVILRPFRVLVYYRDQIQQTFNDLEERFGANAEPEEDAKAIEVVEDTDVARIKKIGELREDTEANPPAIGSGHALNPDEAIELMKENAGTAEAGEAPPQEPLLGPNEGPELTAGDTINEAAEGVETAETGKADEDSQAPPREHTGGENEDTPKVEGEEGQEAEQEDEWTSSAVAYQQMKALMDFMHADIQPKLNYVSSEQCQRITFNDLWYLFKPGDEVVERSMTQAYRIVQVTGANHRAVPPGWTFNASADLEEEPLTVRCVFIDFDGKSLGPVMIDFPIKKFEGEKLITSLDVYPLRCIKEDNSIRPDGVKGKPPLRERLIKRGEMFLSVTKVRHMHYNGYTLETRDEVDSQVVIDFEEALSKPENDWTPSFTPLIGTAEDDNVDARDCSEACCRGESIHRDHYVEKKWKDDYIASLIPQDKATEPSVSIYPRPISDIKIGDKSIPEEDLLIMSYRVFGYVLRSRKWAKLDLRFLTEIGENKDSGKKAANEASEKDEQSSAEGQAKKRDTAFDRLVLPKGHKEMVLSLIAQHFRDKESSSTQTEQVDLVRGKGKGLIILLHGAPGVGKTTTAEGVAELFKKPLFQITCGDLGTTANDVEKALETHFALANKWGCILLLDEADVFLAARTPQDFIRNGMVAVFLRVLEYYAGILFLTTNRIGDFDEAFSSRIHISLHYPQLDLDSTSKIFQLNLDMIRKRFAEKKREIEISEEDIIDYATTYWKTNKTMRWNGRQIRNACQTALALAEFDAQGGDHEKIIDKHAEVKLELKHLHTVGAAYLEFMKYLGDVYGRDADKLAKQRRLRASEFNLAENVGVEKSPLKATDSMKEQVFPGSPPISQPTPPATSQESHQSAWLHGGAAIPQPPHLQTAQSMTQPPPAATGLPPSQGYPMMYPPHFPQHAVSAAYSAWANTQGVIPRAVPHGTAPHAAALPHGTFPHSSVLQSSIPQGSLPQGTLPHGAAPSPGPSGYVSTHPGYGQAHHPQGQ